MTKRELLIATGEALFGPRWQSNLSRELGVYDRTMRRWAAGDGIPDDLPARLAPIVQAHLIALSKVKHHVDLAAASSAAVP